MRCRGEGALGALTPVHPMAVSEYGRGNPKDQSGASRLIYLPIRAGGAGGCDLAGAKRLGGAVLIRAPPPSTRWRGRN